MNNNYPVIAITPGEPAGIGPDLVLQLDDAAIDARLVIIADPQLLRDRATRLGIEYRLQEWKQQTAPGLYVLPVPLRQPCTAGQLDPANADYVLQTLDTAIDGCLRGEFAAMVTGPVHKAVINEAGHSFTGHTEYLAQRAGVDRVVMMLTGGTMRVALATTHLSLSAVPAAITPELLRQVLTIIDHDLRTHFSIDHPRISVCGLNPHAGEDGHLGREEIDIIRPVIDELNERGMDLRGPLPADTAFTVEALQKVDAILAMYHDQGLPVLKHASFGNAINITLGLPFIRSSVDHGTALELAGAGKASNESLIAALSLAIELARQ